ncbi:MAG: type III-B CRISPR-associated protein Cas10/Cmr2, partial [Calditrichaeota bacterium]|nr:type III-B CRISPR-associated protein Cas10/Cmr2 [Calditrichota bacterium]
EARRSRDLRAGSAILSWFMREILVKLKTTYGAKLLIPHNSILDGQENNLSFSDIMDNASYSIPNRASGTITKSVDELKAIFKNELPKLIQEKWGTLFKTYYEANKYPFPQSDDQKDILKDMYNDYGGCPIKLLWIVAPYKSESNKTTNLEYIDQLFNNIKRTRPVQEWEGQKVGKCDQCGRREAIGPHDTYKEWLNWHRNLSSLNWVKKGKRIDAGERLCMVCLTKRFSGYAGKKSFPSTSEIAAREWLSGLMKDINKMTDEEGKEIFLRDSVNLYKTELKKIDIEDEESLYYTRSILSKRQRETEQALKKQFNDLLGARKKLSIEIRKYKSLNLRPEPSNYLAVLTFDGDSMGKRIREKFEQELPEKLIAFSRKVLEDYEENSTSQVFYVGGDEGLILSPIETVLDVAFAIRKLFWRYVNDPEEEHEDDVTLSMGITLFDRERPLGGAIRLAHEALETAKRIDGKNALSITVQTASGNEFSATACWKKAISYWPRVLAAVDLIRGKDKRCRLSMGWAYEIETFLNTLTLEEGYKWQDMKAPITAELKRITLRKLSIEKDVPKAIRQALCDEIWHDKLLGDQWMESFNTETDRERIANALHLIAFLCRESAYQTEYVEEPSEGGNDA